MFIVEVTQPERLLDNAWTTVETTADDQWMDHIESPNFHWSRGTIVRVRQGETLYTGIFNDERCVDVGPNSEVMKRSEWDYTENTKFFVRGLSWIEAWVDCTEAASMLWAVVPVSSMKSRVRAGLAIAKLTLDRAGSKKVEELFNKIQASYCESVSVLYEECMIHSQRQYEFGNADAYNATCAVLRVASSRHTGRQFLLSDVPEFVYGVLMEDDIGSQVRFEKQCEMAHIVRREIPFSEIADALVK